MKKIIIGILMFWAGIIIGAIIIFNNIKINNIDKVNNAMVTVECFGHCFDYYYEKGE